MNFKGGLLIQSLYSHWWRLISMGVTKELSFEEKKITRLLNILAVAGTPSSLGFVVLNTIEKRYPLAIINILQVLGGLIILYINKKRQYLFGRVILSVLSIVVFTAAALMYHNGAEYFLLLNIVATVILFQNRLYVVAVSAVNAIVFLMVKYIHVTPFFIETLPTYRVLFNVWWTLFFIIISLHYFKTESLQYQKQILDSHEKLQDQQDQLMLRKNELKDKTHQLQALNVTREKLFSIIAHDLRSPIAGLKISLDLYKNEVFSKDEFDDLLPALTSQVDTIYNTLDNLLQWSKGQLNGFETNRKVIDLKPLIIQVITLLAQNAQQKNITIEHSIPDQLYLNTDPDHLKVIIRNLLSNAIKFSHPNHKIEIGCMQQEEGLKMYVKDYGIGMTEHQLKLLFNTTGNSQPGTFNEKGTGLGLALCKEFIERNDGSIEVFSKQGEGSTFVFHLPLRA